VPAAAAVPVDPARLDILEEGTGQPELDPSRLWNPDGTPTGAELLDAEWLTDQPEPLTVALLPEGWVPEVLRVLEEVGERLSKIPKGLLLHNGRPFG
jgi:hypothetical protein